MAKPNCLLAVSAVALVFCSGNVAIGTEPIKGQADVIDGDTIEIAGTRIGLQGIDAPEIGQFCSLDGRKVDCGEMSARALAGHVGDLIVTCNPGDSDEYGRTMAVCSVDGKDLGAAMVREGWALVYGRLSIDYIAHEVEAHQTNRGIWQAEFITPWVWRGQPRSNVKTAPAANR